VLTSDLNSHCVTCKELNYDNNLNCNLAFLLDNYQKYNILLLRGGTGSGKTYAAIIFACLYAVSNSNSIVTIVSKTHSMIQRNILSHFISFLNVLKVHYRYNKVRNIIELENSSSIYFISADKAQKLKGQKRNILIIDELDTIDYEAFKQLQMRSEKVVATFNPSSLFFLKEMILDYNIKREQILKTTYLDNKFLSEELKKNIESLKSAYSIIYRHGDFVEDASVIDYSIITEDDFESFLRDSHYKVISIDIGINISETAIVLVAYNKLKDEFYIKELFYGVLHSVDDIIELLKTFSSKYKQHIIVADYSPPHVFDQISKKISLKKASKKLELETSFFVISNYKIFITESSMNLINELRGIAMKENKITFSKKHAVDAMRYAIHIIK